MKLLFTYFIPSGGIETLNRLRYHALRAVGIEAHALYLWNGAGTQNMTGIPHFVTNNDFEIIHVLQTGGYDAIVVTCDHLMLQRLHGLGYRGTIIYEAQGLGTTEQAESTLAFASTFIRMYARGAISPPTSHMMVLFQRYLGDFPRFYVQNMIDTDQFSHRPSPWLNPSGAPILGWIGRLENNKNWPLYLRIAAALAKEKPDLQLWMFEDATISEPGEREKFHHLVRELDLEARLLVRSNIPHGHMPHYLSAIGDSGGMLLSTSYTEGFGYAVAEAMSCRCPVLSTDSDGVRCFIDHNRTGKFFLSRSVEEAVREAKELFDNRPLTEQLRLQAQQHIRTRFSLERYAADIVNVLGALGLRA
ncbi:glycosyltransferase family 4 protein [Paenibacillus glycinis]|uniref:Glycosyltransferase n=1 Tax=Paenibacillus glycinis TaxID=2697035 RepID=A0ABW9XUZ2_9BACL|nr:glycosyltransferase [Paenibacillus glycinis]NBD26491.1 glycosyltransferase [Paenibacillus glycinis]